MKATIKRTCGHLTQEQLFGSSKERDRRESWLRSQPCLECQRSAGREMAREQAQAQGLPKLEGSEKQVAWATTIRATKLNDLGTAIAREEQLGNKAVEAGQVARALVDDKLAMLVTIRDGIAAQAAASWWIDNRNATVAALVQQAAGR